MSRNNFVMVLPPRSMKRILVSGVTAIFEPNGKSRPLVFGVIFLLGLVACCAPGVVGADSDGTTSPGRSKGVIEALFVDRNGNRYEAATFNLCPQLCSCLDDYFECKKMNLKQVPILPNWVRSLDLTGNKLGDDDVVNSIRNLSILISLNIKKNRLRRIPVFKGLLQLEKLNLAHNKIQAITRESLLSLPNLSELDLSKNAIKTILPSTFPTSNKINSLNLNFNVITSLEENSFDSLGGLIDLQMNQNRLTSLPPSIFKFLGALKKL